MDNQQSKAAEQMFAEIMKVIQEYHNRTIREQVAQSMKRKAEAGYWLHRPPVGYSPGNEKGVYVVNRQGRALRDLMKRFAKGEIPKQYFHYSLCFALSPNPRSLASIKGVKQLVSNPFYAGKVSHKGELYEGLHEPLVTPEEQEQIIKNLKK